MAGFVLSAYSRRMIPHRWDVSVSEATTLQNKLQKKIRIEPLTHPPRTIAGADISYNRFSDDFFACVVVLSLPDFVEVEIVFTKGVATFPYVPGYLSFREIPTLLKAFEKLKTKPDVIMADGQGIAHPRRMGIAAHLGLLLDTPAFGCGKHLLYGKAEAPNESRDSFSYLIDPKNGERIGALVRTKNRVAPIIVSPGHRITLDESIALALDTARGYRIPEPTRRAHDLVNRFRIGEIGA
jgi:deoxyribonuclease V